METPKKKQPGLLVEDATMVGGVDAVTGAPVIRPKTPDGTADESVIPTDARECRHSQPFVPPKVKPFPKRKP